MARAALTATMLAAAAALAACSGDTQRTPDWLACKRAATAKAQLAQKAQACGALIDAGASGDDLETALRLRGETYRLMGNDTAAMRDLDRAIQLKPDDSLAFDSRGLMFLRNGQTDKAMADFNAAVRADPDNSAGYNNRGLAERQRSDYADALRDEDRAIELKPDDPRPWANRGLIYVAEHQFDLALADFGDALRLNPRLAYALDGRGDADAGKKDLDGAVQAYDQAAAIYIVGQNYPRALADSDRAVGLKPDDPGALNDRCWARAIAQVQLDGALADCRRSLALRPDVDYVLDSLAFAHFRAGDFEGAIRGYDAALAKNPKLAQSLYMRGIAKLRTGDAGGGQADIDAATALDAGVANEFASYGVKP